MHHLKETAIDGVKFVLIPEVLHDNLVELVLKEGQNGNPRALDCAESWQEYDPEIFE